MEGIVRKRYGCDYQKKLQKQLLEKAMDVIVREKLWKELLEKNMDVIVRKSYRCNC